MTKDKFLSFRFFTFVLLLGICMVCARDCGHHKLSNVHRQNSNVPRQLIPIHDFVFVPTFMLSNFEPAEPKVLWAEPKKLQFDIFVYSWHTRYVHQASLFGGGGGVRSWEYFANILPFNRAKTAENWGHYVYNFLAAVSRNRTNLHIKRVACTCYSLK